MSILLKLLSTKCQISPQRNVSNAQSRKLNSLPIDQPSISNMAKNLSLAYAKEA